MRNIWRIFRADWQRISASVVAVVVIMGLCLIPCMVQHFFQLGPLRPRRHVQYPRGRYQRG